MRPGPLIALLLLVAVPAAVAKDLPGQRFHVRPADMPKPYATSSAANPPERVTRPARALPQAPVGYSVNLFADGFDHARWLLAAPSGEVFLAEPNAGRVMLLVDPDGDGRAERRYTFAKGHETPHGLALHGDWLYVADLEAVWRYPWKPGRRRPAGPRQRLTPEGALGDSGGHWTRNIAVRPDGKAFFVSIGSQGNLAEEPEPRATIKRFPIGGGPGTVFARGLRNPVGIAFHPETRALYTVVNERDGLGDGLVPDYLTSVRENGFYGWPYAYIGPNPQPGFSRLRPGLVKKTIVPEVLFQSHSAPLGLVFAAGGDFPTEWQDDAFVALHGSWNAAVPTGYKVVRVPFENGRPLGWYENFVTGFRADDRKRGRAAVWGRPVGLAVAADGSLLIADDAADAIWRVRRKPR